MADKEKPKHGLHVRVLDGGDVALDIYHEGRQLAGLKCNPLVVSSVVAKLILASNEAMGTARNEAESPKLSSLPNLPFNRISLASGRSATDERTMVLHAGAVELKFLVSDNELRGIRRTFGGAWISHTSKSIPLLLKAFRYFLAELLRISSLT
jgi:hypothetical protein